MQQRRRIKELIADHLGISLDEIRDEADFIVDLGADSLALAGLVAELEGRLEARVPSEELLNIATVGDILRLFDRPASKGRGRTPAGPSVPPSPAGDQRSRPLGSPLSNSVAPR